MPHRVNSLASARPSEATAAGNRRIKELATVDDAFTITGKTFRDWDPCFNASISPDLQMRAEDSQR